MNEHRETVNVELWLWLCLVSPLAECNENLKEGLLKRTKIIRIVAAEMQKDPTDTGLDALKSEGKSTCRSFLPVLESWQTLEVSKSLWTKKGPLPVRRLQWGGGTAGTPSTSSSLSQPRAKWGNFPGSPSLIRQPDQLCAILSTWVPQLPASAFGRPGGGD